MALDPKVGVGQSDPAIAKAPTRAPVARYQITFVESPFFLVSIFQQIRAKLREPKSTIPQKYYRGEATLPIVEMTPWYRDIPNQIRALFEKPKPPLIPITSKPIEVPEIWNDYQQQPVSWLNSVLVHVLVSPPFRRTRQLMVAAVVATDLRHPHRKAQFRNSPGSSWRRPWPRWKS
jgi:hypothetical protein